MSGDETNELRKTFLKWSGLPLRIPDEMANAEGCEIFAGIPRSETIDGATAFISPNAPADSLRLGFGDIDGVREMSRGQREQ